MIKNDIIPENYGGETQVVQISALYGRGIDKLQVGENNNYKK